MARRNLVLPVLIALAGLASPLAAQVWNGDSAVGIEVRDRKRKPIEGAQVLLRYAEIEPIAGPPAAMTGADGKVEVQGLAPGRWRVDVSKQGYSSYLLVLAVEPDGSSRIVSGPVRDATGDRMRVDVFRARLAIPPAPPPPRRPPPPAARPTPAPPEPPRPVRPEPVPPREAPPVELVPAAPAEPEPMEPAAPEPEPMAAPEAMAPAPPPAQTQPPAPAPEPMPEPPPRAEPMPVPTPPPATPEPAEPMPEPAEPMPEPARPPATPEPKPEAEPAEPMTAPAPPPAAPEPMPEPAPAEPMPEPAPPRVEPRPAPPAEAPPPVEAPAPAEPMPEPPPASRPEPETTRPPAAVAPPRPAPAPAPAPSAPAPQAAPSAEPPPLPWISAAMRSATDGSCDECEPDTAALTVEQLVGSAGSAPSEGCAPDLAARLDRIAALLAGTGASEPAPLISRQGGALQLLQGGDHDTEAAALVTPFLRRDSACQALVTVLPAGAQYVGYAYEASDAFGSGPCTAGEECAIGSASFIGQPTVVETDGPTILYGVFHNRSQGRERLAQMIVYFKR